MINADIQTENEGAPASANANTKKKFDGTVNPRHLRAITALMTRPQRREHLDMAAGCSNSPELIAELRRRGLDIPCERVPDLDRDGLPIKRGVYYFLDSDRRKVSRWLTDRDSHDH